VLSGRGLCDELITRPEESYRLCCVVVCDLETSRMGASYIYDISRLRVKQATSSSLTIMYNHGFETECTLEIWSPQTPTAVRHFLGIVHVLWGSILQPVVRVPCSCAPRLLFPDAVPNRIMSERTLRLMPGARSAGIDGQGSSDKGKQGRSLGVARREEVALPTGCCFPPVRSCYNDRSSARLRSAVGRFHQRVL